MKVHFIAIGGSAMHNLAIALHLKGYIVSGSDDEIFEPSRSRLKKYGLLPSKEGWYPERISEDLDAIILGMHAHTDNIELAKAKQLGIKIFSYPEYLYEQSKDKIRVVVGGSHGKTTITSMIIHALNENGIDCNYMVGAQLEGYDVMVKLSEKPKYMIIEGDEYLTSPIDRRPKFHLYQPDIAIINGIAWDHINVFPSFDNYVKQFEIFSQTISPNGCLIYYANDDNIVQIADNLRNDISKIPYTNADYRIQSDISIVVDEKGNEYPLKIFGKHNLQNVEAAKLACLQMGLTEQSFYSAIQSFTGASNRLQVIHKSENFVMFKDFAHAPSKLKATLNAVKEQYPLFEIVACLELHTYSSLNKIFLSQYADTTNNADFTFVYFSPHALEIKRLESISREDITQAFHNPDLRVFNDSQALQQEIVNLSWKNKVLLMMSSGNFGGIDLQLLLNVILNKND